MVEIESRDFFFLLKKGKCGYGWERTLAGAARRALRHNVELLYLLLYYHYFQHTSWSYVTRQGEEFTVLRRKKIIVSFTGVEYFPSFLSRNIISACHATQTDERENHSSKFKIPVHRTQNIFNVIQTTVIKYSVLIVVKTHWRYWTSVSAIKKSYEQQN